MNYIEFRKIFKDSVFFSKRELLLYEPNFDGKNLVYWQKKGYLKKIIKGYYLFPEYVLRISDLYCIANNIYFPSYISTYQALSFYNLIPEQVITITAVSTKTTKTFNTDIGIFKYHNIKKDLFWGYGVKKIKDKTFYIADIEKTVLDFFYFNKQYKNKEDILGIRFDFSLLQKKLNLNRLNQYLKIFNNKTLEKTISIFLELMNNA